MTEEQWRTCISPEAMLNHLTARASPRKLRLYAIGCCRRIWPLFTDERCKHAVNVAQRFVDGRVSAADLGMGLKSKRKFCDIVLSDRVKDGVAMAIPAHRGPTTLRFDLHNRYTIPREGAPPESLFARHTAAEILAPAQKTISISSRRAA